MNISHHVGEDLLLGYGAGTLDEASSLLVATHLALCPRCRADLDLAEAVGGALIECAEPGDATDNNAPGALADSVAGDSAARRRPTGAKAAREAFVLPQPLRGYAGGDSAALGWRAVGGGIRQVPLTVRGPGATARLLSIPAGKGVPHHGHRGFEMTLVLAGAFFDRHAWYRRGDVQTVDEAVVHRPVAGPEEDCICLAVTDAPLNFRGLFPRVLQLFHGI